MLGLSDGDKATFRDWIYKAMDGYNDFPEANLKSG